MKSATMDLTVRLLATVALLTVLLPIAAAFSPVPAATAARTAPVQAPAISEEASLACKLTTTLAPNRVRKFVGDGYELEVRNIQDAIGWTVYLNAYPVAVTGMRFYWGVAWGPLTIQRAIGLRDIYVTHPCNFLVI